MTATQLSVASRTARSTTPSCRRERRVEIRFPQGHDQGTRSPHFRYELCRSRPLQFLVKPSRRKFRPLAPSLARFRVGASSYSRKCTPIAGFLRPLPRTRFLWWSFSAAICTRRTYAAAWTPWVCRRANTHRGSHGLAKLGAGRTHSRRRLQLRQCGCVPRQRDIIPRGILQSDGNVHGLA